MIDEYPDGCAALAVRVTPKAGRNAIEAPRNGRLIVRVTAAPEDGKANVAVLKLVAKALGLPKSSLEVVAGVTARDKTIALRGVTPEDASRRLTSYLAGL
ncbi:MAG: DUF167 domain-containing protein [Solirubrobacterales bacterium]